MSLVRKLKPDRNITGALIPLSMLPIFGLASLIFGIPAGLLILAVMIGLFLLYYLYLFIRTGNAPQLVFTAEGAFLIYMFITASGKFTNNFALDGEVSVHIARKDYLDYRQPLAFDQLCNSLGTLFVDFFELYTRGEGVRVINRLDDLRIGIFS
jgi:hypothetical protein